MKTTLITPAEVLALAFPSTECQREELVGETMIETARIRWLEPVLGALCAVLEEERYKDFTDEYIKPALAYYVRYLALAECSAHVATFGVVQGYTAYAKTAPQETLTLLRKQARSLADTLLNKAVAHVENDPERFPEYDPEQNVGKRVLFKGGFIL